MPDLSIHTFDDLLRAAGQQSEQPRLLFLIAGAELLDDTTPASEDAEAPLRSMVESIKPGSHRSFIPFDRNGRPVLFH